MTKLLKLITNVFPTRNMLKFPCLSEYNKHNNRTYHNILYDKRCTYYLLRYCIQFAMFKSVYSYVVCSACVFYDLWGLNSAIDVAVTVMSFPRIDKTCTEFYTLFAVQCTYPTLIILTLITQFRIIVYVGVQSIKLYLYIFLRFIFLFLCIFQNHNQEYCKFS